MSLLGLLVVLLVVCVVLWAARALMGAFGVEDPIRTVIYVVIVILVLAWVLQMVGLGTTFRIR